MELSKHLTAEEKWQNATLANNFIFYKVMHNNPDICKELLEILLEMEIDRIEMKQEEMFEIDYGKKCVRLDVYATGESTAYNIEMQASDTGEIPERARYYQSVIDVDDLSSGRMYKEIKTSYIIFICIQDIFKHGLGKYIFENLCVENPKIKLNDRSYKYFFIAENCGKLLNEKQKSFLKLLTSNECTSDFAGRVSRLVEDAKHNTQWRKQFMDLDREKAYAFHQGLEEGKAEGASAKAIEVAKNLLRMNLGTPEQIAKITYENAEKLFNIK